ncbi:MAG: HEAT repeat domain-containing protein [Flavobacteriales bacterium]|nr:HEAT repeat domain-containing protein [Flavobacteriales bacterium]
MEILGRIWDYYNTLDFAHRFVSGVIFLLVFTSILLLIGILISRTYKNRVEKQKKKIREAYQHMLVQMVFEPEYQVGQPKYKTLIGKYNGRKSSKLERRTLVENIVEMHQGVTGTSAEILEHFYRDTNMVDFAVEDVKKGEWWVKARAFRELSELRIREKFKLVLNYVDHSNKVLRSEAQYASVQLGGARSLSFVEELTQPISEWDQLVLLEKLERFIPEELPDVSNWLDSQNDSVVIFACKIITQFRMFKVAPKLIGLLNHSNSLVTIKGIDCIISLEFREACPSMRRFYPNARKEVQIAIIDALAALGDTSNLNLFRDEIEQKEDFDIAMHSAMALRKLGGIPILNVLKTRELKYPKNNEIVLHALDKRI